MKTVECVVNSFSSLQAAYIFWSCMRGAKCPPYCFDHECEGMNVHHQYFDHACMVLNVHHHCCDSLWLSCSEQSSMTFITVKTNNLEKVKSNYLFPAPLCHLQGHLKDTLHRCFIGWNTLFSKEIQQTSFQDSNYLHWLKWPVFRENTTQQLPDIVKHLLVCYCVFLLCISSWPQKLTDDTEIDWETDRNS